MAVTKGDYDLKTAYNVGIYCRLSREDNNKDISLSIENQMTKLQKYVNNEGWDVFKVYADDGVTGTTFNRPFFNEMLDDIENGRINCVVVKDLSRLGRNRLESGHLREVIFPEYDVRLIAVDDSYDSETGSDSILFPIKELLNEEYAKDISRKTRSAKRTMAEQGKFANSRAPYGYLKSKENKHVLVVDENVAHNVIRIFELYLSGKTGRAIADIFNREGIAAPNDYFYSVIGKPNPYHNNKNMWGSATIMNIIKNPLYYGAMANGKRVVKSFRDKSVIRKPFDEWIIVENTHEPIISKEIWLEAQKINRKNSKYTVRRSSNGETTIFAGIIKCAACGGNLVFNSQNRKSDVKEFFRCSTYTQKGKNVCSMHSVDYDIVCQAVLHDIQQHAILAIDDEKRLIDKILKSNDEFNDKNLSRHEKTIRQSKNRIKEIDGLLQNLYEDKITGEVAADLFKRMSQKYSDEQAQLIVEVEQLENELDESKRTQKDIFGWIKRIKDCLTIDSLTRAIVVELIDRIEVSEIYDLDGEKNLDISISYKFGYLPQKAKEPIGSHPTKDNLPTNSIA